MSAARFSYDAERGEAAVSWRGAMVTLPRVRGLTWTAPGRGVTAAGVSVTLADDPGGFVVVTLEGARSSASARAREPGGLLSMLEALAADRAAPAPPDRGPAGPWPRPPGGAAGPGPAWYRWRVTYIPAGGTRPVSATVTAWAGAGPPDLRRAVESPAARPPARRRAGRRRVDRIVSAAPVAPAPRVVACHRDRRSDPPRYTAYLDLADGSAATLGTVTPRGTVRTWSGGTRADGRSGWHATRPDGSAALGGETIAAAAASLILRSQM